MQDICGCLRGACVTMPEGPELHLACRFVNKVCLGRTFTGSVEKSSVSKNNEVEWNKPAYTVTAVARGKELKLTLSSVSESAVGDNQESVQIAKCSETNVDVVFRFGMTGSFHFSRYSERHKHAHLNFFVKPVPGNCGDGEATDPLVLSFVDQRRFGSWTEAGGWSAERGPCILTECVAFR